MTGIPWSSLKKVHDAMAQSSHQFLAARKPVGQMLFPVKIENGEVTQFEQADPKVAARIRLGDERMEECIQQLFDSDTALGGEILRSVGFVPDVVVQVMEVVYSPSTDAGSLMPSAPSAGNCRLLICVHTAKDSFPVVHPIEEGPTRRCDLREFPKQSCKLSVFLAGDEPPEPPPKAPEELQAFGALQRQLGEGVMDIVLAVVQESWTEACLDLRVERGGAFSGSLNVRLPSGRTLPIRLSGELVTIIQQVVKMRGAFSAEAWSGMKLIISQDGRCNVHFNYDAAAPAAPQPAS